MPIPMNIVLDLVLGLVLLSILYTSWQRGFIASLIHLVGTAAGFALAAILKSPIAEWGYKTFLEERVENYVSETLLSQGGPLLEALGGLDQAGAAFQSIPDFLGGILAEQGLDFYAAQDAGQMGRDILTRITENGTSPAAAITQVAVKPLVMTILETVIFFVLLFLAGIVVRFIVRVGLGVNRIPVVGGLNRVAGLACGAVYALLVGYVIANGLVLLAGLGKNQWEWLNSGILQKTFLVSRFLELRTYLP